MAEYNDSAYIQPKRLTGELRGSLVFGVPGASAYEVAVRTGFVGTEAEWLASLVGPDGPSAYEVAVQNGFEGSSEDWLRSLQGKSAYEVALANGFKGTEEEWLKSLIGTFTEEERYEIEVMKSQIADLQYHPITITSFTVTPSRGEMGEKIDGYQLSWVLSKAPVKLVLDGVELPVETEGVVEEGEGLVTATRKFTLVATDERGAEATKSCYLTFYNGVYYGAAPIPEAVDSAFVLGLATKTLTDTRKRTITVTAGEGEYIWYCYPKRMQKGTFWSGVGEGGFDTVYEVSVTNQHGYVETYYVHRSDTDGPKTVTTEVK